MRPARTPSGSQEGSNAVHRFVKRHRALWVPAGWLSRVVTSAPESSLLRSALGPLRDRIRGAMKIEDVLHVLEALEAHDVPVSLAGGWGVDALLGRQTRSHDDVDIVVDDYDRAVARAVHALAPLGYRFVESFERHAWMPKITVLENDAGRRVELNSLDWTMLADGVGPLGDGVATRRAFEDRVFSVGTLGPRQVPCLSADVQLLYHTAFVLEAPHRRDVALLRHELGATTREPA